MLNYLKKILKKIISMQHRKRIKDIFFYVCNKFMTYSPYEKNKYPFGLNLTGYVKAEMGLGEGCRLIAKAIERTGIDFVIFDYEREHNARKGDFEFSDKIGEPYFSVNIVQLNADQIMKFRLHSGKKFWRYRYNIAHFAWELPEFPKEWKKSCDIFDEIWTPSNFCTNSIKKITDVPVYTMPFGIEPKIHDLRDRSYFNLPDNKFIFLTMFDVNSVLERKNPAATIRIFKQVFSGNNSVGLVAKINDFKKEINIDPIMDLIRGEKNIYVINTVLSRNDINSLIRLSDVFVSLHRSEGFGLAMAESMYFGKPVIATNWSSNTDFMSCQNSCPIKYKLVSLEKDFGIYKAGSTWAEPDEHDAAKYMEKIYSDKEYYKIISDNAILTMKTKYSVMKSAEFIKERLSHL